MSKKLTTEEFIKKAKEVHGDKYDYSLSEYKNSKEKIKIICPEHGEFEQIPNSHLIGSKCKKCGYESMRLTQEEFIIKSNEKHKNVYE